MPLSDADGVLRHVLAHSDKDEPELSIQYPAYAGFRATIGKPKPPAHSDATPQSTAAALGPATASSNTTSGASAAATSSSSSLGSGLQSASLRVPLLEESNRLLRTELDECARKREAYKAQIYALEKHKLDMREEVRTLTHQLQKARDTLEDRKYAEREQMHETDKQVHDMQANMRKQMDTMRTDMQAQADGLRAEVQRRERELASTTKRLAEAEDALYQEREAGAQNRRKQVEQLEADRVWKQQVELELKKQLRALCVERNAATQRASQLADDLATTRRHADAVVQEKQQLLEQLYNNSRLAKEQPRECLSPEAALLSLQKTEIAHLTRRLASVEADAQERIEKMRREVAGGEGEAVNLRAKGEELKEALRKCMAAMDLQRDEREEERRAANNEIERMQAEYAQAVQTLQQQMQQMQMQMEQQQQQEQLQLQQPPVQQAAPMQSLSVPAQVAATFSDDASTSLVPPAVIAVVSSGVAAADTVPQVGAPSQPPSSAPTAPTSTAPSPFHLLSPHEALAHTELLLKQEAEANERRRLKRLERRQALELEQRALQLEEEAANGPPPSTTITASVPPLDLTKVPSATSAGVAPASQAAPTIVISANRPAPAAAAPAAEPLPPLPPSILHGVEFNWAFMDENMPSFQPAPSTTAASTTAADATATAAPSAMPATASLSDEKEAQLHAALKLAMREVEADRKRAGQAQPQPVDPAARLAAAMEALLGGRRQEEESNESSVKHKSDVSALAASVRSRMARTREREEEEGPVRRPLAKTVTSATATRKSLSSAPSKRSDLVGPNKENIYKPSAAVVAAAQMKANMAPLKRPSSVPRLSLPPAPDAHLPPPRTSLIQRAIAEDAAGRSSRASSARSTSSKKSATSTLRNVAASLKKHKTKA